MAIHWDDIDSARGLIYMRRTVNRITVNGFMETEPKTKSSRCRIVFPEMTLIALKVHRVHQDEACIKTGEK